MTLLVDVHEPKEIQGYLGQTLDLHVCPLNERGFADYMWTTLGNTVVHVERKQWGEVLSGMDKVENQLREHMSKQPKAKLLLLVEGMAISSPVGTVVLKGTQKGSIFVEGYTYTMRMDRVYGWLYQIGKYIETYFTTGYLETCTALGAFYKGDQKLEVEHSTFQRYFKKVEFQVDPRVTQLMGLMPGIGEKRAIALISRFTTVWNIVSASPEELEEVEGIGKKLSVDILRKVGRVDV